MKQRLDQILVLFKLASSRTKAQEIIKSKGVVITLKKDRRRVEKFSPSTEFDPSTITLEMIPVDDTTLVHDFSKFVSRAGLKLDHALNHLNWKVKDLTALDLGQSTGGFSDCLLQRQVGSVVGVDIGEAQVAPKILKNSRNRSFEKFDVREIYSRRRELPYHKYDLIVSDLSHLHLSEILEFALKMTATKGRMLALIKPQYELDKKARNKKGVVRSNDDIQLLLKDLKIAAENSGWTVIETFPSKLPGKKGNQEYFLALQHV